MNARSGVLLVGRRNGAIRAAKALGLSHVTIPAPFDAPDANANPKCVVALTEAAVSPAAKLRSRYGLDGLSEAAALACTDKLIMKQAVTASGVPTARFIPVNGDLDKQALIDALGLPLVLKTRVGSGGRGTRVIRAADEIPNRVEGLCLAESFVAGVEMSVEAFVIDGAPIFTNFSGYLEPKWSNLVPSSNFDDHLAAEILAINRKAIGGLGISRGITHMEVFLTPEGIIFGELGARPPGGHLMRLMELAYGFDPWAALLQIELGQIPDLPNRAAQTAGVRFIYPDAGVVQSVNGLDAVRELTTAVEVKCTLQPGERISARESTGQHRGFAIFAGSQEQVVEDLTQMKNLLRVAVEPES